MSIVEVLNQWKYLGYSDWRYEWPSGFLGGPGNGVHCLDVDHAYGVVAGIEFITGVCGIDSDAFQTDLEAFQLHALHPDPPIDMATPPPLSTNEGLI